MATDIRKTILGELRRQGRSRYWLAQATALDANGVYKFLRGDGGARMDSIERMLDALGLRIVPGELADRIGKAAGKGGSKSKSRRN